MTTTVNLGKIAFVWQGTYDVAATYAKQDVVAYNGGTYVSLDDGNIGNTPGTLTSYWQLAAQGVSSITTTSGQVLYNNGTGLVALPIGTEGQVLTVDLSGFPSWEDSNVQLGTQVKALWRNGADNGGNAQSYRMGCCIMNDDSIRLWGANANGMFGDGTSTNRSNPTRTAFPPEFPGASTVTMDYNHNGYCIDTNGELWTWGYNAQGSLADGTTTARYWPVNVSLLASNSIYGKTVTKVYVPCGVEDAITVAVICSDGTLHICGYNGQGQCGDGTTTNRVYFGQVTGLGAGTVVDFCFGRLVYTPSLAVTSTGALYVWGYNADLNLGDGTTTNLSTPYLNTLGSLSGKTIIKCTAGAQAGFAIDSTGNVHSWGRGAYGQLGNGSNADQSVPVQSYTNPGATTVTRVLSANYDYFVTYFLRSDGLIFSCGYGGYGANGSTTSTDIFGWTQVAIPLTGGEVVTKICRGGTGSYNWALTLTDQNRVYSWGYNGNGALGIGNTTNQIGTPQLVKTGNETVIDISIACAGSEQTALYLYSDGALAVCGYGGNYANGDYNGNGTTVPVPMIF